MMIEVRNLQRIFKSTRKNTPVGVGEYRDRGEDKMNYKS
jgi:hypothetical protein